MHKEEEKNNSKGFRVRKDIQNKKKEWVKQEKMEEVVMGITVRKSDGSANHHFALPNVEPLWQQNMFYSVIYYIQVHTR